MFSWIGYAIFGLVAGAIARLLHPGKDPMNWLWTMLLGLGGAEVGGLVIGPRTGLIGWISAVVGAIVLLILYNYLTTRNATSIGNERVTTTGPTTNEDYKQAVFDDLSKGPR